MTAQPWSTNVAKANLIYFMLPVTRDKMHVILSSTTRASSCRQLIYNGCHSKLLQRLYYLGPLTATTPHRHEPKADHGIQKSAFAQEIQLIDMV